MKAKLFKRLWGALARLFRRLREVQGKAAADEVVAELVALLTPLNAEALKSLHEAGADLIALLHSLEMPNTLHRNLLSTNAIDNSFRYTHGRLGRVTRFRADTDQATHWLSITKTEARDSKPSRIHWRRNYKLLPVGKMKFGRPCLGFLFCPKRFNQPAVRITTF